jgi:hypothetical protein
MAQAEQLDVLILGSGTGGKLLAWHDDRILTMAEGVGELFARVEQAK